MSAVHLIDPFIGTGGFGFGAGGHNPGAQVPHGALRLGPDTVKHTLVGHIGLPFNHYGGYHHPDNGVRGFSHTHLVGAGVGDYGNFGVLPTRGGATLTKALVPLDHSKERAGPGWYALNASGSKDTPPVRVLLAASGTHAGVHSYTFVDDGGGTDDDAATCALSFDACHGASPTENWCKNSSIYIDSAADGTARVRAAVHFAGHLSSRAPNGALPIFFYAEIDGNATIATGTGGGVGESVATLRVPCSGPAVTVRASISFISASHAAANLRTQAPAGMTATAAMASAQAAWQGVLQAGGVRILDAADASASAVRAFHTAVYRTRLAPTVWDEPSDGGYLGMDGQLRTIGSAGDARVHAYTDMSLWDVHRTQLPWLSLTAPRVYADVVRSLEAMGDEGGDVPRWPLANVYTGCMVGNHAIAVLADAVSKGLAPGALHNASRVYQLLKRHATEPREHAGRAGVAEYLANGFVPVEVEEQGASLTLAYAFDDASLATLAAHVGEHDDAATLSARSTRAVEAGWSAERELMCPKSAKDGKLHCPLLADIPYPGSPHYVEGDAWQWLWFAPSDPSRLVSLFATPQHFVDKLDTFLTRARATHSTVLPNPFYWAGNEPDLLAPWLFAFVPGEQPRTAAATRWIAEHRYGDTPDGLPGNDDYGTLSAWLVWAQIGLYPLAGTDKFILGAPRFGEVEVGLGGSGTLRIVAHNVSAARTRLVRAVINGRVVALDVAPFVHFGELRLSCGKQAKLEVWYANA